MEEQIEALFEDVYLEELYGSNARLENEEWLKLSTTTVAWLFDPSEIRKKLVEIAELDNKHTA